MVKTTLVLTVTEEARYLVDAWVDGNGYLHVQVHASDGAQLVEIGNEAISAGTTELIYTTPVIEDEALARLLGLGV